MRTQRDMNLVGSHALCASAILVLCLCGSPAIGAEEGTVTVNGVEVDYLKIPPKRGPGLSHDEILDLVRVAKPAKIVVRLPSPADGPPDSK